MKPLFPVLAYQKIGVPPKNSRLKGQWTSAKKLERMLAFLQMHNYTFITPLNLQKKLPAKPVLLAFFGGYESFYMAVFPLLKKYQACATLFIATDTLGTYNSWQDPYQEPWQNILTKTKLHELIKSKLVTVGTLGLSGKNLLTLEDPARAREDILESIHRLKMLHKIDAHAIGFWPDIKDKTVRIPQITHDINLPIITPQKGFNLQKKANCLRILHPNLWTRFLLRKNS